MFVWVCMLQVHTVGFVVIIHPNTRTHDVVTSQWGCGGALRVSSSRIAKVYFGVVFLGCIYISWWYFIVYCFCAWFLMFHWVNQIHVVDTKARLTFSLHFFRLIFKVKYFFGGTLRAFRMLFQVTWINV